MMLRRDLLKLPFVGVVSYLGFAKEVVSSVASQCKQRHTDETIVLSPGQHIKDKIFTRCKFVTKGVFRIENCEFYDCGRILAGCRGCVIKDCYFQSGKSFFCGSLSVG